MYSNLWEACAGEAPCHVPFPCRWSRHDWRSWILLRCLWQTGMIIYSFSLWYWAERVQLRPEYAAVTWVCNTKLSSSAKTVSMAVPGFVELERSHFCKGIYMSKFKRNLVPTVAGSIHYHQCVQTTKLNWAFIKIWTERFLTIWKTTFFSLTFSFLSLLFVCLDRYRCPRAQQHSFTRRS